jgi:spore coat protein CotF
MINGQQQMQERELMDDVLSSQKHITGTYNDFTNECVNANVRSEFMRILNEEHQIQSDVFDEMKKRGWYQTPNADLEKVQQAKQKFQNQQQQMQSQQ